MIKCLKCKGCRPFTKKVTFKSCLSRLHLFTLHHCYFEWGGGRKISVWIRGRKIWSSSSSLTSPSVVRVWLDADSSSQQVVSGTLTAEISPERLRIRTNRWACSQLGQLLHQPPIQTTLSVRLRRWADFSYRSTKVCTLRILQHISSC